MPTTPTITVPDVPLTVLPGGRLPYRTEIPGLANDGLCPCDLGVMGPCDIVFQVYEVDCETSHGTRLAWMLAHRYMAG